MRSKKIGYFISFKLDSRRTSGYRLALVAIYMVIKMINGAFSIVCYVAGALVLCMNLARAGTVSGTITTIDAAPSGVSFAVNGTETDPPKGCSSATFRAILGNEFGMNIEAIVKSAKVSNFTVLVTGGGKCYEGVENLDSVQVMAPVNAGSARR